MSLGRFCTNSNNDQTILQQPRLRHNCLHKNSNSISTLTQFSFSIVIGCQRVQTHTQLSKRSRSIPKTFFQIDLIILETLRSKGPFVKLLALVRLVCTKGNLGLLYYYYINRSLHVHRSTNIYHLNENRKCISNSVLPRGGQSDPKSY